MSETIWLETFDQFADHIHRIYGVKNEKRRTEQALHTLAQTGSVAAYYSAFMTLANRLGFHRDMLFYKFYDGLKEDIKDRIADRDPVTTFHELADMAIRIDDQLSLRALESRRRQPATRIPSAPSFSTNPRTSRPIQYTAPPDQPIPMDINVINAPRGPLAPQERDRRRRLNLCLYRGKPGQIRINCPVRPQAPRTAEIAELQLEAPPGDTSGTGRAEWKVLH